MAAFVLWGRYKYRWQSPYHPQSLKYLWSGLLQKKKNALTSFLPCFKSGVSKNKAHPVTSWCKNIRWLLMAYTEESKIFYDATGCPVLVSQALCALSNNAVIPDIMVSSEGAKILSHLRLLTACSSIYNTLLPFFHGLRNYKLLEFNFWEFNCTLYEETGGEKTLPPVPST